MLADMRNFLVESYVPRSRAGEQQDAANRARLEAEAFATEGVSARYIRSIYVPADETCFHLLGAASAESAAEIGRRASISVERVVEAVIIAPSALDDIEGALEEEF
jgi:hypothetical protein